MISEGLKAILLLVRDNQPIGFAGLEPKTTMCERILSSHLVRLTKRGYLVYDKGMYTITESGMSITEEAS